MCAYSPVKVLIITVGVRRLYCWDTITSIVRVTLFARRFHFQIRVVAINSQVNPRHVTVANLLVSYRH